MTSRNAGSSKLTRVAPMPRRAPKLQRRGASGCHWIAASSVPWLASSLPRLSKSSQLDTPCGSRRPTDSVNPASGGTWLLRRLSGDDQPARTPTS
ncbi:MAG: hypothetical protein H6708_19340 [Kofleriaceae bacterium]|nr:hypothetical protein [Kofleriaceae bacterium]